MIHINLNLGRVWWEKEHNIYIFFTVSVSMGGVPSSFSLNWYMPVNRETGCKISHLVS